MKIKAKNCRQIEKFIQNKESLCRFNLSDSWYGPYRNVDAVLQWFFNLFEPKCALIRIDNSEQLKKIINENRAVFLIKQNGVIRSADRADILKLI